MIHVFTSLHPAYWQSTIIKLVVAAIVVPTTALILGIVFLFKVMSCMQSRLGAPGSRAPRLCSSCWPTGPSSSRRKTLIPDKADRIVFKTAPLVVLMSTLLLYAVLPASEHLVIADLDVGIFFALAVSSLSVIGVLMAGWGSANKYSLMGALRGGGQLIAYELPLVLAVVGVVIQAGTLSLNGIVEAQANGSIFGFSGLRQPVHPHPVRRLLHLPGRRAGRADPDRRSTCRWPSPSWSAATRSSTRASAS